MSVSTSCSWAYASPSLFFLSSSSRPFIPSKSPPAALPCTLFCRLDSLRTRCRSTSAFKLTALSSARRSLSPSLGNPDTLGGAPPRLLLPTTSLSPVTSSADGPSRLRSPQSRPIRSPQSRCSGTSGGGDMGEDALALCDEVAVRGCGRHRRRRYAFRQRRAWHRLLLLVMIGRRRYTSQGLTRAGGAHGAAAAEGLAARA